MYHKDYIKYYFIQIKHRKNLNSIKFPNNLLVITQKNIVLFSEALRKVTFVCLALVRLRVSESHFNFSAFFSG